MGELSEEITRVHTENLGVYGAAKSSTSSSVKGPPWPAAPFKRLMKWVAGEPPHDDALTVDQSEVGGTVEAGDEFWGSRSAATYLYDESESLPILLSAHPVRRMTRVL